jgi:hypothetical protein
MNRAIGKATRPPLPARAKWFFAVTALLVSACFFARRPGVRLEAWQKWLLDAPMLVMVAISSLIWATWRRDIPLPVQHASSDSETFEKELGECDRTGGK